MALAHITAGTHNETNPTTSCTITIPASGVQVDDVMEILVNNGGATAAPSVTDDDTGGNTWTNALNQAGTSQGGSLWWKRLTSGSAGKTVTISGLTDSVSAAFKVTRGARTTSTPLAVVTGQANAAGTESHAGITPPEDNCLVNIAVFPDDNALVSAYTATNPATLTERAEALSSGGADSCASVACDLQTTAAATGTINYSQGGTVAGIAIAWATLPETASLSNMATALAACCAILGTIAATGNIASVSASTAAATATIAGTGNMAAVSAPAASSIVTLMGTGDVATQIAAATAGFGTLQGTGDMASVSAPTVACLGTMTALSGDMAAICAPCSAILATMAGSGTMAAIAAPSSSISGTLTNLTATTAGAVLGARILVQDEGAYAARPYILNFTGAGVTAARDGYRANIEIPGMAVGQALAGGLAHSVLYVDGSGLLANSVKLTFNGSILAVDGDISATGFVTADDPVLDNHVATKNYVDDADTILSAAISAKVAKAGDTMTGLLTLSGAPSADLHAATKKYVDDADAILSTAITGKVAKAGDTMTGFLTLHAAPTSDFHAATKKYVDDALSGSSIAIGDTVTGGTDERILFVGGGGLLSQDANLKWNTATFSIGGFQTIISNTATTIPQLWVLNNHASGVAGIQISPRNYDAAGGQKWKLFSDSTARLIINDLNTSFFVLDPTGILGIGPNQIPDAAWLHLAAGTTSIVPFRLTSGSLKTAAVAGGIEFLTDKFYGTITTGAARKELALSEGLTSGRVVYTTTNGRLIDSGNWSFDGSTSQLTGTLNMIGTLAMGDGNNISFQTTTGTKIGTATTQKIGFWNATPVTRRADIGLITDNSIGSASHTIGSVNDDSGGAILNTTDATTINDAFASFATQLNEIRTVLRDIGLTA